MTQILPATSDKAIKLAGHLLRQGGIIAFPTDTLYGIGADAFDRIAAHRIFAIKKRPLTKALPVFIRHLDDLELVAGPITGSIWPILQKFWPGALTVILPKNPKLPDEVTAGQATVAVRFPDCAVCHALAAQLGRPLAVTSANLSDLPTPATAQGVAGQLGEDLALVLDGGPSPTAQASTILDVSGERPRLLRQGDLKTAVLRALLPTLVENF